MMKIYISGPITGTSDYMERFKRAEELLLKIGDIPVNPAAVNSSLPEQTAYEEYMNMSITMLDMCDAIYMMNGWERSCGANREYGYALAKEKIIVFEQEIYQGKDREKERDM